MLAVIYILTMILAPSLGVESNKVKLHINGLGTVVGQTVHLKSHAYPPIDARVSVFKGVPYAEPPKRFAKPQSKKPWSEKLIATEFGSDCPQLGETSISDEDCLFMNIWSPFPRPKAAAVMVFIHGGAFQEGSGAVNHYNGVALVAYNDIIYVNFNYRLGVLGFLSTGAGTDLPGNYGLWDQVEALKWVKEHIVDFGGDPNRITIFGQSAGAASVSLMTVANQTWEYYDRAIMESGNALSSWAVQTDQAKATSDAINFGNVLLCPTSSTAVLAECIKKKPLRDVMLALGVVFGEFSLEDTYIFPFSPTIDGDFLTDDPATLYGRGEFKPSDVILGTNRDDGSIVADKAFAAQLLRTHPFVSRRQFNEKLGGGYVQLPHSDPLIRDIIAYKYVNRSSHARTNFFWPFIRISTDQVFVCPTDIVAKAFASTSSNTYLYQLTHVSSVPSDYCHWEGIVPHGDELGYVFGAKFNPLLKLNVTAAEVNMTLDVMRYWTNFAKTGNPNEATPITVKIGRVAKTEEDGGVFWNAFNDINQCYKDLAPAMVDKQRLRQSQCCLWNTCLPQLIGE